MKKILLPLFALTLVTLPAFAEETAPTNVVDKREDNQQKRIEQGVESGSLTKHEARKLEREQKRIGKAEEKAEADGTVTRGEAKRLRKMQNHASHDIARKKHNRRR